MKAAATKATILTAFLLLAGCAGTPPRPRPPLATITTPPSAGPQIAPTGGASAPGESQPWIGASERPPDSDLLLIPDPVPVAEPRAAHGNPPFYEVYGTRYTVLAESHGYIERGVASWYGLDFHGLRTSTGEPYDMFGLTAAHKTLPLPAYVEVSNLKNGRSVVVRVNDRGPFKSNRIIDLSYTAALKLGMLREGTSLVEVRALDPGGPLPPPPPPAPIYAQAGAFTSADNATSLMDRLQGAGFHGVSVYQTTSKGTALYRVRVGPIASVADYDALVARLHSEGVAHAWLSIPGNDERRLH